MNCVICKIVRKYLRKFDSNTKLNKCDRKVLVCQLIYYYQARLPRYLPYGRLFHNSLCCNNGFYCLHSRNISWAGIRFH